MLAVSVLLLAIPLAPASTDAKGARTSTGGPFPSDRFTVVDPSQNTGLRVNLPKPDCAEPPSDCADLDVINMLDGFNLQPRLSIPFAGAIDLATVASETVFLVSLGSTLRDGPPAGTVVGIDQVVWDPDTNTLHAETDALLAQHTRYVLVVTSGVRDPSGAPAEASERFEILNPEGSAYRDVLFDAVAASGVPESEILAASVFTTQSATAILEKIRDQIHATTPAPADFRLGPGNTQTVFPLSDVAGVTWQQQTTVAGPLTAVPVPIGRLTASRAVGEVAFGKFRSPDYEAHPGEFIPPVGTLTGTPAVQGHNEIYFNLVLPAGPTPPGGWPVAIFGHGNTDNKNVPMTAVAGVMAQHGVATIGINAVGHGFGSLGTLTVTRTVGEPVTFSAGGRGMDQDNDGEIGANEGASAAPPRTIVSFSDGIQQTTVDLMQLVHVIQAGVSVHGDGSRDLDPSRIYYVGQSLGGNYGTVLLAVEPNIKVGVLNVAGAPILDNRRLGACPTCRGPFVGTLLAARVPSLLNDSGVTLLAGAQVDPPYFNENMPLRNGTPLAVRLVDGTDTIIRSPVSNSIAGALEIQRLVKNAEWAQQAGSPVAYAPHLRKDPLQGVPVKSVVYQFARGDYAVPNPNTTAILRAADLTDRTTLYRNDLAFEEDPKGVSKRPHGFLLNIDSAVSVVAAIARGAQEQIGVFFASDGTEIIHPEPARFFEVPVVLPLPEDLGYIP